MERFSAYEGAVAARGDLFQSASSKDPKADVDGCSVLSAFSALHVLRYNHLLAHPELRPPYPLGVTPECLLPPRGACAPRHPHFAHLQQHLHHDNGSSGSTCLPKKRGEKRAIPDDLKDDRYYERRKRNNQAAKKSRDARRIREDQIAMRAMHLEHENAMLTAQNLTLREEIQTLRQLILKCNKSEFCADCKLTKV